MACTADPTVTLLGATRRRTLAACDACKQSRRRCSGEASCSECAKRGLACIYSPSTKKRGPRFTTSLRPTYATSKKVEAPALPPCAIGYPLGVPGAAPSMEVPLLTQTDVCLLRRVFSFTNLMIKIVDEQYFLAALNSDSAGSYSGARYLEDASPLCGLVQPSCGLRACAFALLCVGCKLRDDDSGLSMYYNCAQDCLDQALAVGERPDQHLVSAILLMTLMALAAGREKSELAALSSLAYTLTNFVDDLSPEIRFSSASSQRRFSQGDGVRVVWPAIDAPIGSSQLARYLELGSFVEGQIIRNFVDVDPAQKDLFFSLCDEGVTLQTSLGVLSSVLPALLISLLSKATIAFRDGLVEDAIEFTIAALSAFTNDLWKSMSCIFALTNLVRIPLHKLLSSGSLARVLLALAALIFLTGVQGLLEGGLASDLLRNAMDGLREHKRSCDPAEAAAANAQEKEGEDASRGCGIAAARPSSRACGSSSEKCRFHDEDGFATVLQALVSRLAVAAEPPAELALVALRRPLEYEGENRFSLCCGLT